jgi:putative spermidine/putrescine transport system permease protein
LRVDLPVSDRADPRDRAVVVQLRLVLFLSDGRLSLRWYAQAFGSHDWQLAFANSIGIGAVATLIATCLGTLAALGLSRPVFPFRAVIMPLLISPMIIPIVVVAAGFYLIFAPLGLVNSYMGVMLAHAALGTPFVVITVTASLLSFDQSLLRAAPVSARGRGPPSAASRCR